MLEETLLNKQRTIHQNNALHLWCQQVSDTLNEAGISYKMLLDGLEIDQTPQTIKGLFRLIAGAKYNKHRTTELTTKELMDCFEELNRHLGIKGIHVPFPSEDELNLQETYSPI